MKLVDIGANLTHQSFEHDRDVVVADSRQAGLAHIILTGTDLPTSQASLRMARQDPNFFSSTVGFHPHIAQSVGDNELSLAADLAAATEVVAVGETGLDFNRNYSPAPQQESIFERHLELAAELHKPLFLHQRDAHDTFINILSRHRDKLAGGVVHCFTDTEQALRDYLELDMYIGITGWICDERRGQSLQELVSLIPADRLLIETDAPYLLPRTINPKPKSRRNEPKYLVEVVNQIARSSDREPQDVAKHSICNAIRLFGLENRGF